jgi:creatinine amidohydrolase
MPGRPYVLAETTWDVVRNTRYEVAVLPWGATEAHNYHLPYSTDTIESEAIAAESARLAWEAGAKTLVLPCVPFGVQTGQREVPFCLNMNPSTQTAVLAEIIQSVEPHGPRKLVILNGHGGNDFKQIIRELQPRTGMLLCQLSWFRCMDLKSFFDEPGDHAGEMETSLILELAPEWTAPLDQAGAGRDNPFRLEAFREGWAWTQRRWVDATNDTGVGDPSRATAEKGRRFLDAVCERIAGFLVELAEADPTDLHEKP